MAGRFRRIGSDTGGTFTDLVDADGTVRKEPSTPHDPSEALRRGLAALPSAADGAVVALAHGTTVATNALLERRGATVALFTTAGCTDVIEIGRQDRPDLYDPFACRPEPLVPRHLRFGIDERLAADATALVPFDRASFEAQVAQSGLDPADAALAVAVCLLHADLCADHERAAAEVLRAAGFDVSCSHELTPEFREYERTVTTALNAYLRPVCRAYLRRLDAAAESVSVLTSAGGLAAAGSVADVPARLLLSGPAGGVLAGAQVAVANGFTDAVTFDMGGTSTDVCLVLDGRPSPAAERHVAGLPVRLPSLDVHTIGAGGGSVARLDAGGVLVVGPESAGAVPGPACYGRGGEAPTVTDADLVLGRIPAGHAFAGLGALDVEAARRALDHAGVSAPGVVAVVDAAMQEAVRQVTVHRGIDPAGLALVAFGGAGPLHACAVADALGMPVVIVPARAGVLSAVGILCAPHQVDLVRSWPTPTEHDGLDELTAQLVADALGRLVGDGAVGAADAAACVEQWSRAVDGGAAGDSDLASVTWCDIGEGRVEIVTSVDCRYSGQSHEVSVRSPAAFPAEHERRHGFDRPGAPVEAIAVRVSVRAPGPINPDDLPPVTRTPVVGPAVVAEGDCTIWVPPGWAAEPGHAGALLLRRKGVDAGRWDGADAPPSADRSGLQVLMARLAGVADEMSTVLRRAACSPNIKERADCSSAVFDSRGELLAQAENIPVHLGAMPASVAAVLSASASASSGAEVADVGQWIVNDPFVGGTHLNDLTVVAPCVVDGTVVGWVANRAHHADVGGSAPGSIPAGAVEVFEEGLRIPPLRCTPEVRALVVANSRTPVERAGDLEAQLGANRRGVARLAEVVARFGGAEAASERFDEVLAYGERRMRAALASVGDGVSRFEDQLDSFGPTPAQQQPVPVVVTIRVEGDAVTVDFTGSGEQQPGNVNAVEAVTRSAVAYALRSALDPGLPANGGCLRPVRVVAPPGSVVAARAPAAVGAGNVEVSQRVADVCLGALAALVPGRVGAAGQGTMNNVLIGGDATGGGFEPVAEPAWVYYETVGGGQGGRPAAPGSAGSRSGTAMEASRSTIRRSGQSGIHTGMTNTSQPDYQSGDLPPGQSGIHTNMTNTRNTPVEALERAFPLRVLRQRLRRGSGGAGRSRGGEGIERDLQVLVDATLSLITERRVSQPWGLAGGEPGAVGENWLLPGGDEARAERLPDKCTVQLEAGDVVRMLTPGGGGWGSDPGG